MKQFYLLVSKKISFKKELLLILFLIAGIGSHAQNCTVNAGVLNETICETEDLILEGNTPSPIIGSVLWTQIDGPAVIINSPNSPITTVSGYTGGNTYIFRYSATCGDGILAYQDKVINVLPITIANAGTDIASCPDSSGALVISGNTPTNPGETGHWEIIGNNGAGVTIDLPNSATSTITLPATSCGTTTLEWIIEGLEYAPGQRCRTTSQITVTNYGGVNPVSAGSNQTLSNCYTTTQSTTLNGSYGGCGLNGQNGEWEFVSGPNTPTISNINSNSTNISNLIEGTYVFRWTVNGPCVSGTDQVIITVPAATQDITILPGGTANFFLCDSAITQITLEAQTPLYAGETVEWTQIAGDPGAVIVSPNNPTTLVTNLSDSGDPYTFRYIITNNNTGCSSNKDYVVQYNGPTRTIIANNDDNLIGACDQTSFSIPLATTGTGTNMYRILTGPAASPLGPFPTGYSSVGNTLNIELSAPGGYIIEFIRSETGSLPVGCDYGFDSITVLVSNEPTPSNAGSDQNLACGVTSTLLSGVTASTEGNNFWSQLTGPNTAVIADGSAQDTNVSGLIPGTYVFQYITKGGGATCGFSVDTVTINVSDTTLSTPNAGPDAGICINSIYQLSGSIPDPGEYGEWSQVSGPSAITFSNVNDPDAVASGFTETNSTYVLRWTIAYSNPGPACSAPVFDDIEIGTGIIAGPALADAGPDTCYPAGTTEIQLSGSDPGPLSTGLWTVTPSAGVTFDNAGSSTAIATVPADGTYIFTWTITPNIGSCPPTFDSVTITIADTNITADAGPDQSGCNDTFVMAATASVGATGAWALISGLGGYTISDVNDPNATFTFTNSGFYIFRWTVEAEICGEAFDDISIAAGIPPTPANAGPDQDICNSTSVTMAANDYDAFFESGQWSVLSGAPNSPTIVDASDPNTTITGLVAGTYTFRWSISARNVFVCPETFDDVVIEVAPLADAGADENYCDVTSVQLIGTENSTGIWSQVSGPPSTISQTPSNSYIANATVIPGNDYEFEYTIDEYTFSDSSTCPESSDSVNIQIFSGASIDPDAGPDQTLCIDDVSGSTTMDGNTPPVDVDLAEWRFVHQPPGSVATIDDPNDENTTVSNLTVPGLYILEWVFESASCRPVSDIVRIVMYEAPSTANAGPDDTVACQFTYQTNAVPPAVGIGTWSFANPGDDPSGGDVVIDNPNNPVTTLSNITTLGTYVLTWTVTNGPFTSPSLCEPSVDQVAVTFNDDPPSLAIAGPDQELCNANQATMSAVPVTSGIGTWTQASGPNTANIASPNSPTSVMFGLIPGTYEFTWTTTTINNDGCSSDDTMEVIIYALPSVADAGPNQVLPQFDPVVMAANTPATGIGNWSQVSGPSTVSFIDINSPTTAVTGTIAGTYTLQWNITNGNCTASIDQVTIEIIALADLELTKSVTPTTGSAGDIVTFTLEVFNNDALGGSVDATGVSIKDMIPLGYVLVPGSVSNSGLYNIGDHSITWLNLSIPNGNTLSLTFNATIDGIGPYTNTAEIIASDQIDPDSTPNNNIATEDDQDDAAITLDVADLSLSKTVTPGTVSIGDNVVFTITVTNNGPDNASGVTVTDQLPAGYAYVSDNSSGAYNNTTGIWTIGNINNGASASIQITATVNAAIVSQYQNIAEVETVDQFDPDSTPGNGLVEDDRDDAQITLQQADLELTKDVAPASAAAGDQVTFTLTLLNNGPGNATGVIIEDYIPTGYTLVPGSVSNGGVYNLATATITWSDLSVASGASQNLTFIVTVNATGNYNNTTQVTASDLVDPDSTPDNDDGDQSEDDEDDAEIIFIGPSADLSLTKTVVAGNTTPVVGSLVSFEVVITNDGPNDATGVNVLDLLPSGYDFVNFSSSAGLYNDSTGLWNVGTVDAGVSESLIIDAIVLPAGDYVNIAEVTASNLPDPDSTPNNDDGDQSEDDEDNAVTTPIQPAADLFLTKIVNNPTPLVGSQVTFVIVASNSGPQFATNITVTDLLPSGYTFNSFNATTGSYNTTTGLWTIGNLANGESETLQITATVNATGDYTNVAEITACDLPDPDSTPGNGVPTEDDYAEAITVPVIQSADLSLTKTVNSPMPLIGSQVTFEVVVTNTGPQNATGVEVTDLLPSGYTFSSFTISTGTYNNTSGIWIVGNLASGESETLQLTATVNATGDYENTAEVTASSLPDPDSTPANANDTEDDYASAITTPVAQSADLSITKTVNNPTPLVGSQVTFEVIVTNIGPQGTEDVAVTDLLPTGYTYVSYSATSGNYDALTGLWAVGDMAAGISYTLQITATVNTTGNYENIAEITASSLPDPDSTINNGIITEDDYDSATTTPVAPAADLSINKTLVSGSATPLVGSQITFSVNLKNNGPQNATGVQLTDLLPSGYSYVSYSASTGAYDPITGVWDIGPILNGGTENLFITVTVNAAGDYLNTAEVTASDQPDPDSTPNNNITTEDDYSSFGTSPISESADLSLLKTINNLTPLVGSQVTFEVVVTNNGPQDSAGVEVTDLLPGGYTYNGFTVSTGTYNNTTGIWVIGNLATGESETLQVTATVNATGNYENTAEVTASSQPDPDSTVNNGDITEDDYAAVATTPIPTSADLSLTKTVNNTTPLIGSQVTFSIQVANAGSQDAGGVTVTDMLPTGYNYVSYSTTSGNYNNTTGLWIVGNVPAGASHTLQITAIVNVSGIYLNTAEITTSNQPDPDSTPGNGVVLEDDYASAITTPVAQSADLSLTKIVNNPTPLVGSQVTFEIVVTNNGPQDAAGVEVTDLLPTGYIFVSASATAGAYNSATGLWTVGSIPTAGFESLQIIATVIAAGDYENIAEVTASSLTDPDSTPANAIETEDDYASVIPTPVAQSADLSLTKTVNNPTPLVGSQLTFEVVVTNSGPQDVNGVEVIDLLPTGYTYNSFNATIGTYTPTTGLWNIGTLAFGQSVTLQVIATVNATGNYENIAEVTASSLPDPDSTPGNSDDTEDDFASAIIIPVAQSADLSLTKTVNNPTPLVGSQVTFEVVVTNSGPQDVSGVEVTDLLPTGYTFISASATAGAYNSTTGLWTVGSIPTAGFETLQIIATVNVTGDYENIAEVTASSLPDPDSTPANAIETEDDYASVITTPVAQSADLSLTKTVNNPTPLVGSQVTFEVVVTNSGPQDVNGVTLTDLLPTGYTFVSASATTGAYNSTTGLWTVGNIPTAGFESLQITATVNATGNYQNIAEVTASSLPDPDSTVNNGDTTEDDYASVIATPVAQSADLLLTKTVNNPTPLVGSQVTFEVVAANDGPQDVSGVEVTDLLPTGYTFISASATAGAYNSTTGLWTVGSISTAGFETLQIIATVNATGNYENIAEVTASSLPDPDSTPANAIDIEDDYDSVTPVPVAQSADLSLTKTVNNPTPLVDSQVTFEVVVTNGGPQDTNGVTVTDILPTGYTYISYSATSGTYDNTTGLWTVGTVLTGDSHTIQITATVNVTGNYENIAEITASSLPDPDSTVNNGDITEDDYASAITVPVAQSADLSLTKTVNNPTPLVGSQVTFEVVVANDGPQDVSGVEVTDLLPTGYTFISASATAGAYNSTTGLWTVGSITPLSFESLQVTATVNATGNYENIAEVTASSLPDPDSTPANAIDIEDDYDSVTPVPVAQSADLSLTKTVNNPAPLVGSQVTFEVIVTNAGPQDVVGVEVTDLLPDGYTYNSFNATTGTYTPITGLWTIGALTFGQSVTLQVTATVNATGNYENIAEVTASSLPDPDSTPNNGIITEDDYDSVTPIPVAQLADLSLTKTVNNPAPLVGSQVTFSLQVTNAGPQDVTGVTVLDLLPSGYNYVSYSTTAGVYDSTTGLWTVGNLASGVFHILQITAIVNSSGNYLNVAEVISSNLPDPDSTPNNGVTTEDDFASVSTTPIPISADLSITKTVNNPTPLVGSGVVFTVIVTNNGPQTATGVQVNDLLPSGYSFIVATTTSGTYNNLTGVWEIGTIANGVSETLLINAGVLASGDYLNISEITNSDIPDTDSTPGNGIVTEDDYASVATLPIAVSADLSLTKTVNNTTPLVGNGVIFEVIITNNGPQDATGVIVTDLLPSGYSYVIASSTSGIYNNTTGEWVVGTLPTGTSETLLINCIVLSTGDYLNVAEVTSTNEPDPDSIPDNGITTEDDYASVATVPIAVSADLSLTKTVNNPTPLVGNGVIFEIIITNNGPQDATGVIVTDLLPSGYSYVIASSTSGIYNNTTGEWVVGTLPTGTSETLLINGTVLPTGDYLNIAEVTSANEQDPDSTPTNGITTEDDYASVATIPILVFADLSITKTVNNTTPIIGGGVIFEIIVTNNGPQAATGVIVTDQLPSGYSYVIASSTEGIYNSTTGEWVVGTLSAGASETLLINSTVLPTGDYLNIAEVSASNEQDPDSTPGNGITTEDDYASVITTPVIPMADLSLTKTIVGGTATPLVGSQIIFNIEVSNAGPAAAIGVQIEDLLPSGYTFVSYNATEGIYNSVTGLWVIGDPLIAGASISLQITAVVNPAGNYENTAEVFSSNVLDPDSTPNNGDTTEDDYASLVTIPIPLSADLSITKTVNNPAPLVGLQVTFEVIVTNDGPQDATGIEITDLLPTGYTFNSFTISTGTYNSTTGIWIIGNLATSESETLQVTATVSATGDYENTAEVTASSLPDPDSTVNNGDTTEDDYASAITTPVVQTADLSLTKTVNNPAPLVGSQITFEVVVTNDGPQDVTGVEVTDPLPTGYTFNSFTVSTGTYNSTTGIWIIGNLATSESETLQVTATVNATGDYENIAEVTASSLPDPDSTVNNGDTTEDDYASAITTPVIQTADLSLTKTVNNPAPLVGSQVTFEVIVTNDGPQDVTGVEITDLLPTGYTFNSFTVSTGTYNSTTGIWIIGNLATSESETLQVIATVNATGDYENIAEVTASSLPDPDSTVNNGDTTEDDYASSITTPVAQSADLSLTKAVNYPTPLVGSEVTFEVVVTNDGPQDTTGIEITDLLPTGYTFNSFTVSTGTYNSTTGIWIIGNLATSESETLQVIATVNATGDYENIAEVTASSLPDPDSTVNNGDTTEDDYASAITIPVAQSADLSLTKTVNNPTPLVGSQVTFEVVVTNNGPQNTENVTVTDLLPTGYTFVSASATAGAYNSTTGLWTVGNIPTTGFETLQIIAIVNATGIYENTAEVMASSLPDPDSTPGNADDTEDDYASAITIPVAQSADLSLTKTVNNPTPLVGSQVTFEVVVTNNGPQDTENVTVTDLLPTGYTFVSASATAGAYNSTTGLWTVGNIPTTGFESLQITATVNATGNYQNIAEVTASSLPDPDSTVNNGDTTEDDYASAITIPITQSADLSLTKTVNNPTPLVGSQVTFEVVVTNDGPQDTSGVQVVDLLPTGYTFNSFNATIGTYVPTTGLWNIGTLTLGQSVTLQVTATVNATGDYENIAEVTASSLLDPDSTPGNTIDTEDDYASAITTPVIQTADLSLTKTVSNPAPLVGSQVTFEVVVTNNGPQDAAGVEVTDLLPTGYTFNSFNATTGTYSPATGLWNVGTLTLGQSVTLQVTATVNTTGDYENIAEVTASSLPDPDSTVNNGVITEDDYASVITTPVIQTANLSLTKTVSNPTPLVGSQVTFEVIVTNNGPQNVAGVEVTDLLPDGYTYNSFTVSTGTYNSTTGIWIIGNLANNESETLQVIATVNATGNYENIVEITASSLPDPDSTPNNSVITEDDYDSVTPIPVIQVADISLEKTVLGGNINPTIGTNVTFQITLTNNGPQATGGVQVMDLLPSGYTFIVYSSTVGAYNEVTGIWNVGLIGNGAIETLLITATVNTTGDYTNDAEVISSNLPDPDSTPGNGINTEDDYDNITLVPVLAEADLSIEKTVVNNELTPDVGSQITFSITVTNSGPAIATGILVRDIIPPGYDYVFYNATSGIYNNITGEWSPGIILPGNSHTLLINVLVNAPTGAPDEYLNTTEVTASNQSDPDSTPDNGVIAEDDYDEISVTPVIVQADLSIEKNTVTGNQIFDVGETIAFEVTVTNDGPGDAIGIVVNDLLPSGFTYLTHTATSGTYNFTTGIWNVGLAVSGNTQTLLVYATVNAPTGTAGEYMNVAEITASNLPDPDSTPNNGNQAEDDYDSIEIQVRSADLSLEKTVSNENANVGETVVFTLEIGNEGPTEATGVDIEDIIPDGYNTITAISNGGLFNGSVIRWSDLVVPVGGLTITYQVTTGSPIGLESFDYLNTAQIMASDQHDPDSTPANDDGDQSEDDEDSAFVNIPSTDIAIIKEVDNNEPTMNSQVTFTITADNLGNISATNVEIMDILPGGYTFISASATSGDYDISSGTWFIPSIATDMAETLTITATVIDNNDYLNTATLITMDQLDTNSSNNEDSATVSATCLKIYNEFSPNGDGQNDTFHIDCITLYPNNVFEVYNRWGDLVYSRKGYDNSWEGTSDGPDKTLPVGTYFYILDLGDGSEKTSGWLYLKR